MYLRKNIFREKLDGFSLIEISMVLLIVGIIAGAMLKGRDLIESAQLKSVATDIQNLQMAYASYVSSYGSLPGDDKSAASRFGTVSNGSGLGKTSTEDAKKVFPHLHAAGLIESETFKTPKIGGIYEIVSEDGKIKLKISDNGNAFLSRKQVISLSAKVSDLIGETNGKLETDPKDISQDESKKYVAKIRID